MSTAGRSRGGVVVPRDAVRGWPRLLETARPPARVARDLVGRATASQRVLPRVLVVGGQRCGTTSVYRALMQQPHLLRPVWRKGVHYFDVDHDRGPAWYRSHFPTAGAVARAGAQAGTEALTFESSPYYLFHPLAAERIARELPDVRVLVLVRDPVERAVSAHAHEHARGHEPLGLAAALEAEAERMTGEEERLRQEPGALSHAHRHQAYRARGEYAPQIERFADLLGRDRVVVLDSHRFFASPDEVWDDVLARLGTVAVRPTVFERHNARPGGGVPAAVRADLEAHFAPFDARLEPWLGGPPSWRR